MSPSSAPLAPPAPPTTNNHRAAISAVVVPQPDAAKPGTLRKADRLLPGHRITVETFGEGETAGWRATISDGNNSIIRDARGPSDALHAAVAEAERRGWIKRG